MADDAAARDWDAERNAVHDALSTAIRDTTGNMVLGFVAVAVVVNDQGEKALTCWTAADQRLWETMGMLEFVRQDHHAHLTERRINPEDFT